MSQTEHAGATPVESHLASIGEILAFAVNILGNMPRAIRLFPAEVFSRMADLIRSSLFVMLFMMFILGAMLGITGSFLLEGIGLDSYVASLPAIATMRGVGEIVFCWVLAAKYGCGIVAEVGAMRISEEVDAMDVMGIPSRVYLLSTRVVAAIVVLPTMFVGGLFASFWGSHLTFVNLLNTVSPGGFDVNLYLFQGPRDFFIAVTWASVTGVVVTLVACFYGYHASGGPVGVGRATAQSMLANLVVISVLAMMFAQTFYSGNAGAPFGT